MLKKLPLIRVINELKNYRNWIKTINKEKNNPKSTYNKFRLRHNFFYNVYFIINLDNDHLQYPEHQRRMKLIENTAPINRYLDEELKFAEYLIPEFNQVINDTDNSETPTYVILYRFAFKYPIFTFFIKRIILLIVGIILYNNIDWTNFFTWIKNII